MDICQGGEMKLSSRYLVLGVVLTAIFMAVIDGVVVTIALPTITRIFSVDIPASQWAVTAYLIVMAGLLIPFGALAEKTGMKKLFMSGLLLFTLSSLLCGFAPTLAMLILFRVFQAIGASMVFAIAGALIYLTFPQGEQGRAMGFIGATVALAGIAGPAIGGAMVETFGWGSIFLINVPIGALLIVISLFLLKVPDPVQTGRPLDIPGAVLFLIFSTTALLAISFLSAPAMDVLFAVCLLTAVVSCVLFIRRMKRCPAPLVEIPLFANRRFMIPFLSLVLSFIASFMMNTLGPFYFEYVAGLTPGQVGMVFLLPPLLTVIASPVAGWIYDRARPRLQSFYGLFLMAGSFIALAWGAFAGSLATIIAALVPMSIGSSLYSTPNSTELMQAVPAGNAAMASGVSSTGREFGMALGVSLSAVLLSRLLLFEGYPDAVSAPPEAISMSLGVIMVISGLFCVAGAFIELIPRSRSP